jgi:hypothetical protein
MKVYQYKNQEILFTDQVACNNNLVNLYQYLLLKLLLRRSISQQRIFKALNFNDYSVTSKPAVVEALLGKEQLPVFTFLVCAN